MMITVVEGKKVSIQKAHISTITNGDTILHDGNKLMTVCSDNIRRNNFMGLTIFGDSYQLGNKPVLKVTFL